MTKTDDIQLPDILAGPILRRLTCNQLVLWLVTSQPFKMTFQLFRHRDEQCLFSGDVESFSQAPLQVGERVFIYLIDYKGEIPQDELLEYELTIHLEAGSKRLVDCLPHIVYPGWKRPLFVCKSKLDQLFHGSCRKPHYTSKDALTRVDGELQSVLDNPGERPALLMMSGDQIYADDVGGPMLVAIHQVGRLLGLYPEKLSGAVVKDSEEMLASEFCYYRREDFLPHTKETKTLRDRFFGGVSKPIFTTASAHNHLVTLSEVIGMYLLVWSPVLWPYIDWEEADIPVDRRRLFASELPHVKRFSGGLASVQRLLAHLATYMIFDDHDITDDWNLTRGWEEVAYANPFSRRIIGNTLVGYFLFQGWGNDPDRFDETFMVKVQTCFEQPGERKQDELIDHLLGFEEWHYTLPTTPKMVVLDTRTSRWRSETSMMKPSGLMDWESLSQMQQELMDQPAVLLVSPAPIFGVKLIEVIQRVITFFGHPLVVDAENWMAHPGSANVILNIFRHRRTPKNFIILSGDVHYSFAYDINLKHSTNSPNIWQITCSGFKNEFPHGLLAWFDRLNRWLYAAYSPLNWFTKRRRMRIRPRKPDNDDLRHLVNESSVGRVLLNNEGEPTSISVLPARGGEVRFHPKLQVEEELALEKESI